MSRLISKCSNIKTDLKESKALLSKLIEFLAIELLNDLIKIHNYLKSEPNRFNNIKKSWKQTVEEIILIFNYKHIDHSFKSELKQVCLDLGIFYY